MQLAEPKPRTHTKKTTRPTSEHRTACRPAPPRPALFLSPSLPLPVSLSSDATLPSWQYAVSCIIMQKNGAGIATSGSAHWDEQTDACAQVVWQENRTIVCILTIMGVAI